MYPSFIHLKLNIFAEVDAMVSENDSTAVDKRKYAHRTLMRGQSEGQYLHDTYTIKGSDGLLTAASRVQLARLDSWEAFEDVFSSG